MTRRGMRSEGDRPYADTLAVSKDPDVCDHSDPREDVELRIAPARAAFAQDPRAPFAHGDICAAQALQFRDASSMVEMGVGIEYPAHVFDAKAKRSDTC